MADTIEEFQFIMSGFIGSQTLYKSPIYGEPKYTEGVQYFLANGGKNGNSAYWFMDILATEPAIRRQAQDFASITLIVVGSSALLTVTDGNRDAPVYERRIEYTDAWEGEWKFFWTDGVLMYCREY